MMEQLKNPSIISLYSSREWWVNTPLMTMDSVSYTHLFADYAAKNKVVRQLIDLALLQNGMLKGEALNNFVKRSIDLIK